MKQCVKLLLLTNQRKNKMTIFIQIEYTNGKVHTLEIEEETQVKDFVNTIWWLNESATLDMNLVHNVTVIRKDLQEEIAKREQEEAATKSKIRYEWHSLELDDYGDIINITIHGNFIDAMNDSIDVNDFFENGSVELVKYYMDGYDIDGETRSAWCANSSDISDEFDDGSVVPKYLKKQIINEVNTWGCEKIQMKKQTI